MSPGEMTGLLVNICMYATLGACIALVALAVRFYIFLWVLLTPKRNH